jgi:hypothetical protein
VGHPGIFLSFKYLKDDLSSQTLLLASNVAWPILPVYTCGRTDKTRSNLVAMFVVSKGVCTITPSKLNTEQQITHGFGNHSSYWALFAPNF